MKRRRLLITGVLLLLGGAIVNVAVAWGCAAVALNEQGSQILIEDLYAEMRANGLRIWTTKEPGGGVRVMTKEFIREELAIHEVASHGFHYLFSAYQDGNRMAVIHAGLPLLALSRERHSFRSQQHSYRYVFKIRGAGFAINTIFYAAMLWMVFLFPFVVRRRRRINRGLCPACAYPVGTSPVCTECGNRVPPKDVESS